MYTLDKIIEMIKYAKDANATNIHMSAGALPAMRIGERLIYMPFEKVQAQDTENVVVNILGEEQKNLLSLNNHISLPVVIKDIGRLRTSVFVQRGSYSVNLKLLDRVLKTPEELSIPDSVIGLSKQTDGLVLICGNKNSGKSTTMAALIKKISMTRECQIVTIEDPIEYLFKHDKAIVNQLEVGIDVKNFQEGIYSAIEQDPDVIAISYGGSAETFAAALYAAESGHLVLTSLQTTDTVSAIEYIFGMFPLEKRNHLRIQLSSVLRAIVSQILVPGEPERDTTLAVEVMLGTQAMRNLILENKIYQIPDVIKASKALGMITMEESLEDLCLSGKISREKAMGYLPKSNGLRH